MHTQQSTDEGLVINALKGDENAFSELYKRYWKPIYLAAYSIIKDQEDALDATQEIAFKLYRSLNQWDARKSKLSTWIHRMATNHSIDCHRARRRRIESQYGEYSFNQDLLFNIPDRAARSQLEKMADKEQVDAILQCADTLPARQKQIFIDRYFYEHKLEDIAKIERCRLGTVKSSLHRATCAIRQFLQQSRSVPAESD